MNTRLRILCEQEYIARRYDDTYKRRIQFASYYLLPNGIAVLKQQPDNFTYQILRNIRKDVNASERFVTHCLNVFAVYSKFKELYGDSFKFFTKSYLTKFDYFPNPLPDAYVSFDKTKTGGKLQHYILECFDSTMPDFAMKKRVEQLVEHADSGDWTPKAPHPEILLVCETERLQNKAKKWAAKALDEGWTDNLKITVTTKENLSGKIDFKMK